MVGSSDLVPQEYMTQTQLMQLQALEELEQQADEFWNVASDYPLPAKNLYLVRVLLLVVPSLIIVYYFIRVTLFPIGAVPLVYLVMHMWLAMIYRVNRSVKLVLLANVASAVAAAVMTAFFHLCVGGSARSTDVAGPCGRVLCGEPADGHGVLCCGGFIFAVI